MKKQLIDIKGDKLFPFHFRVLGVGLLVMALFAFIENPWFSPIPLLLGLSIISAHEGVLFDKQQKRFKNYSAVLGIKKGEWRKLKAVAKLYINPSRTSQFIYTRVTTGSTIQHDFFKAFLKFETGEKLYLASHKHKDQLLLKLEEVASLVDLPIQDLSIK